MNKILKLVRKHSTTHYGTQTTKRYSRKTLKQTIITIPYQKDTYTRKISNQN